MTREITRSVRDIDALEGSARRRGLALLALMTGVFLGALNAAILATALPTVASELDGASHLAWVVTAYLLTQCVTTPLWGKAGDLVGRKRVFLTAIVVFLVGSVLAASSWSMESLVAFRALQGVGAGGLMVTAQALIVDVIPARVRGRYLSVFGGLFGVTSVLGPFLGGLIVEVSDWRTIFVLNVPIGIAGIVLVALFIPDHRPGRQLRVDIGGGSLLIVGVSALVLLLSLGGSILPWLSPAALGLGAVAILSTVLLVLVESHVREPIVPLPLFRSRAFLAALIMALASGIGMLGIGTFLPLYFQYVHGVSPVASGLLQLPQVATMLLGGFLVGRYVDQGHGARVGPICAAAALLAGTGALATLSGWTPLWLTVPVLLLFGLGLGATMQFSLLVAQDSAPRHDVGAATAMSQFFRSTGMSLGTAVFGGVFAVVLTSATARGAVRLGLSPEQLTTASAGVRAAVTSAYADATHLVFVCATAAGALALAGALLLPRLQLRRAAENAPPIRQSLDG